MEPEKGFNPTFENGGYWEYYKDLERQFQNFLEYVPYLEGNEDTYSFRLANLILAIGAHLDSALKEVTKYQFFSTKYPEMLNPIIKSGERKGEPRGHKITDYYPISEEYKLPEKVVTFKCLPDKENISPFKEYRRKAGNQYTPCWWKAYNDVKHHFSEDFKKATLKTVRDALAGAFLLNVIHEPATNRLFKDGIIKQKYQTDGYEKIPNFVRGRSRKPKYTTFLGCINVYLIETSLFIYEYEFEEVKE